MKREEIDDSYSVGRATEVAYEFSVRRRGPSHLYTKTEPAALRNFDTFCKTTFATKSGAKQTFASGMKKETMAPVTWPRPTRAGVGTLYYRRSTATYRTQSSRLATRNAQPKSSGLSEPDLLDTLRILVRTHIDQVRGDVRLAAGTTGTVQVDARSRYRAKVPFQD